MKRGRPTGGIFPGRGVTPVRAVVSRRAAARFERVRRRLAKASGVKSPSDRDVIEYLVEVEELAPTRARIVLEELSQKQK
jgi:hypothetical protein